MIQETQTIKKPIEVKLNAVQETLKKNRRQKKTILKCCFPNNEQISHYIKIQHVSGTVENKEQPQNGQPAQNQNSIQDHAMKHEGHEDENVKIANGEGHENDQAMKNESIMEVQNKESIQNKEEAKQCPQSPKQNISVQSLNSFIKYLKSNFSKEHPNCEQINYRVSEYENTLFLYCYSPNYTCQSKLSYTFDPNDGYYYLDLDRIQNKHVHIKKTMKILKQRGTFITIQATKPSEKYSEKTRQKEKGTATEHNKEEQKKNWGKRKEQMEHQKPQSKQKDVKKEKHKQSDKRKKDMQDEESPAKKQKKKDKLKEKEKAKPAVFMKEKEKQKEPQWRKILRLKLLKSQQESDSKDKKQKMKQKAQQKAQSKKAEAKKQKLRKQQEEEKYQFQSSEQSEDSIEEEKLVAKHKYQTRRSAPLKKNEQSMDDEESQEEQQQQEQQQENQQQQGDEQQEEERSNQKWKATQRWSLRSREKPSKKKISAKQNEKDLKKQQQNPQKSNSIKQIWKELSEKQRFIYQKMKGVKICIFRYPIRSIIETKLNEIPSKKADVDKTISYLTKQFEKLYPGQTTTYENVSIKKSGVRFQCKQNNKGNLCSAFLQYDANNKTKPTAYQLKEFNDLHVHFDKKYSEEEIEQFCNKFEQSKKKKQK